jgi:hypothetical protein
LRLSRHACRTHHASIDTRTYSGTTIPTLTHSSRDGFHSLRIIPRQVRDGETTRDRRLVDLLDAPQRAVLAAGEAVLAVVVEARG